MSVATLHGIYAAKVGSATLGGITARAMRTASEIRQEATNGEVYARFNALYAQKPMAELSTRHILSGLAAVPLTGTAITSGATFLLYAQKQQEGGSRMTGSNHLIYTMREGLLVPRRISVAHQQDASLDIEALITYDGTNDPVTVTAASALPTAVADDERYTLGPVILDDEAGDGPYTFTQKLSMEIDLGAQAETNGADSDIWDTHARIVEIQPSIILRGNDVAWWSATMVPLIGRDIVHTGTEIWLRRRKNASTFFPDDEAEHIKITINGMAVLDQLAGAQGNAVDELAVRIPLTFDGTTAPITFTADQAITPP